MPLRVRRLNMDSSWEWDFDGFRLVVDPWLVGSEIEFFKWLSEQWHTTPPIPPEEVTPPEALLITQSYMDHCHLPTLELLPGDIPILASLTAHRLLSKKMPERQLEWVPDLLESGWLSWNGLELATLHPGRKRDPIYFATLIRYQEISVFYCPHGFHLSEAQREAIEGIAFDLLITSFSDFRLPAWLGGHVNPGPENARQLAEVLQPRKVINTHDEQKRGKGLVSLLAKAVYPDYGKLQQEWEGKFVHTPDYNAVML